MGITNRSGVVDRRFRRALPFGTIVGVVMVLALGLASARAQVVINEVVADNDALNPEDVGGGTPDIVELYNPTEEPIVLGADNVADSYYLGDLRAACPRPDGEDWTSACADYDLAAREFPASGEGALRFPPDTVIEPGEFLLVFCDGDAVEGLCELHAPFELRDDGEEALVLWGPAANDGTRAVVSALWLPRLPEDVSFGRYPDGAGPAIVPVDATFGTFVFSTPTFGECEDVGECSESTQGWSARVCRGAANAPASSHDPDIDFDGFSLDLDTDPGPDYSSNAPAADEPVILTVRLRDDRPALPENNVSASISYRVDGGPQVEVAIAPLDGTVHPALSLEGPLVRRPLDRFVLWQGELPPQPAGVLVEFMFSVNDGSGGVASRPAASSLCEDGSGPCSRIGTPAGEDGCDRDPLQSEIFVSCKVRYRYRVAHAPEGDLAALVINEVVPVQTNIFEDRTDGPCSTDKPDCRFDDYIELYNGAAVAVDLSGLWLSDSPFHPQKWRFPDGASIAAGQSLIVWCDGDGGLCPRPDDHEDEPDDGQECPDPTSSTTDSYHTDFKLDGGGEQIYLFDRAETGFGLIHGVRFGDLEANDALSLCPHGDPAGAFVLLDGSPAATNPCTLFRRGDSNDDCQFNLSDAVFTLSALFSGGPQPPCPDAADVDDDGVVNLSDAVFGLNHLFVGGASPPPPFAERGLDPTEDNLGDCHASCGAGA